MTCRLHQVVDSARSDPDIALPARCWRFLAVILCAGGPAAAQCPWVGGLSPAGPSLTSVSGYAFDSGRGGLVLYLGGSTSEWDGVAGACTIISNARPDGLRSVGAYFDTARSRRTMVAARNANDFQCFLNAFAAGCTS